jgi:hypothetical protein
LGKVHTIGSSTFPAEMMSRGNGYPSGEALSASPVSSPHIPSSSATSRPRCYQRVNVTDWAA